VAETGHARGVRPPSVDALARSIADVELPHPLLVDAARAAIAAREPQSARARAEMIAMALLQPVINATGVLLHTNLGRAPIEFHHPARYQNLELDLATGTRGSRQRGVGELLARASGAYIIVSSKSATADVALNNRRAAMAEAVCGIPDVEKLALEFYDNNRVATWVRDHAGLVPWVRQKIGRAMPGCMKMSPWVENTCLSPFTECPNVRFSAFPPMDLSIQT